MVHPVLMFEIHPSPPLSPLSDCDVAMVPQLPGTAEPSTIIGDEGDVYADDGQLDEHGPSDWSNLYALMSELHEFECDAVGAKSDTTPMSSHPTSPLSAGEVTDAFATSPLARGQRSPADIQQSPSPISGSSPPSSSSRGASARMKTRHGGRRVRQPSPSSPARKSRRIKREPVLAQAAATAAKSNTIAGVLPAGHKPARGRGRQLQLATMSEEQKVAEAKARLEKNRQAAREFRMRRKEHVTELERKVETFEQRDRRQTDQIAKLQQQVAMLQQMLRSAKR